MGLEWGTLHALWAVGLDGWSDGPGLSLLVPGTPRGLFWGEVQDGGKGTIISARGEVHGEIYAWEFFALKMWSVEYI